MTTHWTRVWVQLRPHQVVQLTAALFYWAAHQAPPPPTYPPLQEPRTSQKKKRIVNESRLMQLFATCHQCGVFNKEEDKKLTAAGTRVHIKRRCVNGRSGEWGSCPTLRGMPENNLLVASSILFTGTTYTEITTCNPPPLYLWLSMHTVTITRDYEKSTTPDSWWRDFNLRWWSFRFTWI